MGSLEVGIEVQPSAGVARAFPCYLFLRPDFALGVSHDQQLAVPVINTLVPGASPRGLHVGCWCPAVRHSFSSWLVSFFLLLVVLPEFASR